MIKYCLRTKIKYCIGSFFTHVIHKYYFIYWRHFLDCQQVWKALNRFWTRNSNIQSVKLQFLFEFYMIVLCDSFVLQILQLVAGTGGWWWGHQTPGLRRTGPGWSGETGSGAGYCDHRTSRRKTWTEMKTLLTSFKLIFLSVQWTIIKYRLEARVAIYLRGHGGVQLWVVSWHVGGEVVHAPWAHHTAHHAPGVASESGVHAREEAPEPGVTLLLGFLRQLAVSGLDIVFFKSGWPRHLQINIWFLVSVL